MIPAIKNKKISPKRITIICRWGAHFSLPDHQVGIIEIEIGIAIERNQNNNWTRKAGCLTSFNRICRLGLQESSLGCGHSSPYPLAVNIIFCFLLKYKFSCPFVNADSRCAATNAGSCSAVGDRHENFVVSYKPGSRRFTTPGGPAGPLPHGSGFRRPAASPLH